MKYRIYLLIIVCCFGITISITATDYVVISEILYDTPLNENPSVYPYCFGEFIELYNLHDVSANLTGWQLTVPKTGQSYTFPNVVLPPRSFLIIAYGKPYTYEGFIDESIKPEGWTDFHVIFGLEPETATVLFQEQMTLPNDTCTLLLKNNVGVIKDYVLYGDNPQYLNTKANNNDCAGINAFDMTQTYSIQRTGVTIDLNGQAFFESYHWIGRMRPGERDPAYPQCSPMGSALPINSNIISPPTPELTIRNYITTVNPLVEMSEIPETNNKMELNDLNAIIKTEYSDGLGRLLQTVQKGFTPNKKNLVTYMEYDDSGRVKKEWLPIVVDFDYMGKNQFIQASQLFYSGDSRGFTEYLYSTDELSEGIVCDELIGMQKPGIDMNNRYAAKKIHGNEANSVKLFNVNSETLHRNGYYAEKTLLYELSTDEDGKTSRTYKDKLGRVVMQRQSTNVDTYYVYNDLGQLSYVLPPLAADANGSGDAVNKYGYVYKYDERGNCIYKKLPGCEPIYIVYDKADRLVLSQDGNQRPKGKWTVNKYDILGRVLYTSEVVAGGTLSSMVNAFKDWLIIESFSTGGQSYPQEDTGYSKGWYHAAPTKLLTVNYYDDYAFLELPAMSGHKAKLSYQEKEGYSKQYSSAKGLLTGARTYLLDNSGSYSTTVYYYDNKGNIVQSGSTNHLGGYDIVYHDLDFTGKPNKTLKKHSIANQSVVEERYAYDYDHAGRMTQTRYKLNDNEIVLTSNTYDELGRLIEKRRHNNSDIESFEYNIRNQPTKIKSGGFEEHLCYNTNLPPQAVPNFNGNIAHSTWTYNGNVRGYIYTYDELNRLKNCSYYKEGDSYFGGSYAESFTYDKMGNIINLSRLNHSYPIDALTLEYNGNQLKKVADFFGSQNQYSTKEYRDLAHRDVEFLYDFNGNLTTDLDRDIVTIKYNLLNLPDTIQFRNGNQIVNKYDAAGRKLGDEYYTMLYGIQMPLMEGQVVHIQNHYGFDEFDLIKKQYIDNFTYNWHVMSLSPGRLDIDKIYNPEGYKSSYTSPSFFYYRKDHLGSIREVFYVPNYYGISPFTLQRTQYYSSGLPWAEGEGASVQHRKYNGKEWIEAHGLDEYDSHARMYYPAIMRTTTMDPLAEKYFHISPYAWCGNNPVNAVDLDGREWTYFTNAKGHTTINVALNFSISGNYTAAQINAYKNAISTQFNNTISEVSRGKMSGTIAFYEGNQDITQKLALDKMDGSIGGMTSFFNSSVNLFNRAGELKSLSDIGSDATHEILHTLRLEHPFEVTQTEDTKLLRVAPNSFVSTPTTDPNIVNNIMSYPMIMIDGQKSTNQNSLTKGQLNFMMNEIKLQNQGYGFKPKYNPTLTPEQNVNLYKQYYENYWLNPPGTPVGNK